MGWIAQLSDKIKSLLGFTVYQHQQPGPGLSADSGVVEAVRRATGGELQPIPWTQTRWYLEDLEEAQAQADSGNLTKACQLYRSSRRDGVLRGLLETRTAGIVRLPKRFYGGNAGILAALKAKNGSRSVFDELCPPGQLAAMTADGICIGVSLGELVPVVGRSYPVLRRLDPEWLQFNWGDCRWYYNSRAGRIPIEPGDGRWVLHAPYGPFAPWQWGLIWALGRSFINKEHALLTRAGFIAGVANPAKVMQSPQGATEIQRKGIFKHIVNWGPNTALELPPGFEAKLLELTGQAWQTYQQEVNTSDNEYMVALCGQIVTTTGGSGFANADVHRLIREDLIKSTAEELAYTVNTQILPQYVAREFGEALIDLGTSVEWDTDTPKDLEAKTRVMVGVGTGVKSLREAYGDRVAGDQIAAQFGVPLLAQAPSTPVPIGAAPVPEAKEGETAPAPSAGDDVDASEPPRPSGAQALMAGPFREDDHPRDERGQFSSHGSRGAAEASAKAHKEKGSDAHRAASEAHADAAKRHRTEAERRLSLSRKRGLTKADRERHKKAARGLE